MRRLVWTLLLPLLSGAAPPPELVMPGSQPAEVVAEYETGQPALVPLLHSNDGDQACSFCHVDYETDATAIHPTWSGGMMAHASRDPLMWAALAVAEQDFAGIGDTCIRCHVTKGWLEGRSTPSDGSALQAADADGVTCHLCHRLTDPDDSERSAIGVQAAPFVAAGPVCASGDANAGVACSAVTGAPCAGGAASCVRESFYGNAMVSLFQDASTPFGVTRLGPYADAQAASFHATQQSSFQRDAALCGTCHDVSNPVTGDLAPAHGRITGPLPAGAFDGVPFGDVAEKAAVRNPPYAYGVEQRTYSEWVASGFGRSLVSQFESLPAELRREGGAPRLVRDAAAPHGGDYADGTPRGFTCQSCHMRPANALGCVFASGRSDLPVHDLTGANTWAPLAILWLDDAALHGASRLRLGGGLGAAQRTATHAAIGRARAMLASAASLELLAPSDVLANTVRVVNLTGHKLFTGYPEGRRMWLRVRWYGAGDALLREDGAYGPLAVADDFDGDPQTDDAANTLLDPASPHTRVWQVESGISKGWAVRLVEELGADPATPLAYDRATGAVAATLADAAAAPAGGAATPSFHLAWNDVVLHDDRIPPWGMEWAEARKRNALPVPQTAFLPPGQSPGPGATYLHYDDVALAPPGGARRAEIELLYQTTSWEYVQFLWKSNQKGNAFLANVGDDLLAAWRATGQSEPVVMATATVPEPGAGGVASAALAGLVALARRRGRRASGRRRT
ncbi:MAG: hypothetical protein DCC71_08555 [Proteobacteria bacterium]|nr:MAG: hypothetical protein DCC71_08555 [Pseudomonadota bacterium]